MRGVGGPRREPAFAIRPSIAETGEFALVSPDVATCAECLRDFTDPANRRFGYPFTNCTNCGPRYTIIRDIPYDRPNTTMAEFAMCPACGAEYEDPRNRRFHAQPNACPVCGPRSPRRSMRRGGGWRAGEILAIKGLGGFHLACDARNAAAVRASPAEAPQRQAVRDHGARPGGSGKAAWSPKPSAPRSQARAGPL